MAIKDKLTTLEKVKKWNPAVDTTCKLCGHGEESRDHHFSLVPLVTLWTRILQKAGIHRPIGNWVSELDRATNFLRGKAIHLILPKLLRHACLYFVWSERNAAVYKDQTPSLERA